VTFLLCAVYVLGLVTLYLHFRIPFLFIGLCIIMNLLLLTCCGNYMLRAVLFPYANYFIKKRLDKSINTTYSKEMIKLCKQMIVIIRVLAKIDDVEDFEKNMRFDKKEEPEE